MLYGPSQQHVVAYRPSHSYPITTADDSLLAQAQPPFGELPYVHRDWLSHIANAAADPYLDSVSFFFWAFSLILFQLLTPPQISQPFAVQDFCRSGTSSPAGISAGIGDEAFAESSGIVMPTKLHPRHAPVAGIARLITSWNPKLSIKPSNFVESAAPRLYISDDSISPPRPRVRQAPRSPSLRSLQICHLYNTYNTI